MILARGRTLNLTASAAALFAVLPSQAQADVLELDAKGARWVAGRAAASGAGCVPGETGLASQGCRSPAWRPRFGRSWGWREAAVLGACHTGLAAGPGGWGRQLDR